MRLRTFIVGFACGSIAMGFAAMTLAPKQDPADMEKFMEAMVKYATPTKQHAELAKREGEWTADLKSWMEPGMPPEIMSGQASFKMIMGGRFLHQDYTSEFGGMPFEGAGLTAYDLIKKKYVNVWIDNMGTGIFFSEGKMKNGVVTYKGEMPDVMQGKYIPARTIERDVDENTFVVAMYIQGPDGKDFMTMEITYKRIK